jgi:hypothetical protein
MITPVSPCREPPSCCLPVLLKAADQLQVTSAPGGQTAGAPACGGTRRLRTRAPAPPAGEPGSGRPDRAPWRRPRGGEEATCPAPAPAPQVTHRVHPGPTLRCPGPALRPSAAPSTEILAGWGLGTRSQSSPTTLMRPTCS